MGLAASQARLLTITSRKSDCEYQSMALSHQKIALARDMNVVSNEYQDALNKTKLVYDFYGTNDKSTPLSYALLMSPSKLNDYKPSPVTDPSGRIVLDAGLAAAARAAGIPQEGLGCPPSSDIRNRFIDALCDNGLITKSVASGVKSVQYNPGVGLGGSDMPVTYQTETITFNEFIENYLGETEFDFNDLTLDTGGSNLNLVNFDKDYTYDGADGRKILEPDKTRFTIKDILEQPKENGGIALVGNTWDFDMINNEEIGGRNCVVDKVGSCSYWDSLFGTLSSVLDPNDSYAQSALEYAKQQTLAKVISLSSDWMHPDFSNSAYSFTGGSSHLFSSGSRASTLYDKAYDKAQNYVGYVYVKNAEGASGGYNDAYNINLTNMTRAFYTYFAAYMEGLANTNLKVTKEKGTSNFVTDFPNGSDFAFNVVVGSDTSGDNMLIASFYDALFNQIATQGWVENNNVKDNEYLATMMKNGSMYISSMSEDKYYYQASYATNTYIKEVADEQFIAQAEAKYNREKDKINSKENILDMKMKNLDTEITALTTEYDTVKSVIQNQIKKGFSRYDAAG